MPNVYLQSAPYQPFTYEELAKPLERLQALHDKAEETYTTMGDNAEQIKSQIGDDNPYALSIYNNYEKTFMDAYNSFAQNGVQDPNTRTQLLNVRRAYMNDMGRLSSAITQRQNDLKTRKDAYIKNPNLEMSPVSNLDSYLQGTQTPYVAIDANDVYKRSLQAAKALTEGMHTLTEQQKNGLIYTIKTKGIQGGPEAMLAAIAGYTIPVKDEKGNEMKDENGNVMYKYAFPEFATVQQRELARLKSQGFRLLTDSQQFTLTTAMQQGLLAGMVSDIEQSSKVNPYALENVKLNNRIRFYKATHPDNPAGSDLISTKKVVSVANEDNKEFRAIQHHMKGLNVSYDNNNFYIQPTTNTGMIPQVFVNGKFDKKLRLMDKNKHPMTKEEFVKYHWYQNKNSNLPRNHRLVSQDYWGKVFDREVQPLYDAMGITDKNIKSVNLGRYAKGLTTDTTGEITGMKGGKYTDYGEGFIAAYNNLYKEGNASLSDVHQFKGTNEAKWDIIDNLMGSTIKYDEEKHGDDKGQTTRGKYLDNSNIKVVSSIGFDGTLRFSDAPIPTSVLNRKDASGHTKHVDVEFSTQYKDAYGNRAKGLLVKIGKTTYYVPSSEFGMKTDELLSNYYNNYDLGMNKYNLGDASGMLDANTALGNIVNTYMSGFTMFDTPKLTSSQVTKGISFDDESDYDVYE